MGKLIRLNQRPHRYEGNNLKVVPPVGSEQRPSPGVYVGDLAMANVIVLSDHPKWNRNSPQTEPTPLKPEHHNVTRISPGIYRQSPDDGPDAA